MLATFGANAAGGIDRVAFSDANIEALDWMSGLLVEVGFPPSADFAGNLIATKPGSESGASPIMLGSHVDSVPGGGNYDGQIGSMAALEVATTLADAGYTTRHPLEIAVFTNEETQEKKIIFHPKMLPAIVILDPVLTFQLPATLTAYTGMDALAHGLEAYCSPFFHPLSQGIAVECISLVNKYLIKAFSNGKDLESRANMLVASSMGSTAFQKGLGAIHSLSHPVGAIYNTHHGLTNAVFMPYVLKVNKSAIEEKIISLSRYLNLSNNDFNSFMDWILELRKELGIPHTLKELIQDDSNLEKMSVMAFNDPSTSGNPIKLDSQDFLELYKNSYDGII